MRLNKINVGALAFAFLAFAGASSFAHGNDRGEAKATIEGTKVSINYGRPLLKGRNPLKQIQPGKLWRIGADAPTTLESDADLDFGGTRIPKGKHILLARFIEPGKWSLVVSSKDVFSYEPSAKIAEVPMELQEGKDSAEQVTIQLANKGGRGVLEIGWGTMRLVGSFTPAK